METNAALVAAVEPVVMTITNPVMLSAGCEVTQMATNIPQRWYVIAKKENNEAEIRIYEDIGTFGVSARQFTDDLEKIEAKTLHVRLNTYGGEVFDGIAICNSLRAHPAKIIIHVDGIAASAGSVIAMSGDEIHMANNAFLMIHEANGGVYGEADDMRGYADVLDKLNDSIALTYQERGGKTRKFWREKMAEESWFSAEEAKEIGLCDTIDEPVKSAKNRFDFKIYNHAPDAARKLWARQSEQNQAPEASPRGDVPPVPTKETPTMADTPTAAPAQAPVVAAPIVASASDLIAKAESRQAELVAKAESRQAELVRLNQQAIDGYKAQGERDGVTKGAKIERDRAVAIAAACPGKPKMALDYFLAGQSPEAAKLAFDTAVADEANAKEISDAKDLEIARWQNLAATGGYPGGVALGFSEGDGDAPTMDPKAQAEQEWDRNPAVRKGFSGKERYVNFRKAQLEGKFRGTAMAPQTA